MKVFIVLFALLTMYSCKTNSPQHELATENKPLAKEPIIRLSDFSMRIPVGWVEEQADNKMRVLQLSNIENPAYKITVFYFGQQDMIQANIDRWKAQFSDLEHIEELELKQEAITGLQLFGTFKKKPFPMSQEFTEIADYGMLAAIVPSAEGPYYFKLTAPKSFILEQEKDFVEMLDSYQLK